ncbi:TPA: hypothetical protein DIC40_08140 [Patescibacteria group bacterium]|nr:hypothetical protein P148_SR1C00001G0144 [candidate division SR1 bacterium RAAC1_SR1_1]HCY21754.1 hypothetical protein [Candidatus Gracilibacteria bacterium]
MKKFILFLVILITIGIPSRGQFKKLGLLQNYGSLVDGLEPMKPLPAKEKAFYMPWMDTVVSIHRELAAFLEVDFPLDTTMVIVDKDKKISKEDLELIARISLIKDFPKKEIAWKGWKEKEKNKRAAYEKQRLSLIKSTFEKANADSNLTMMGSTLELMVFYYQNRSLLSTKKAYEEYGEEFVLMRAQFDKRLKNCLEKNSCSYQDVSNMFGIAVNAWPNTNLAYDVLQGWYGQQLSYLFRGNDPLQEITFVATTECFLSLLYLYNIEGRKGSPELVRAYENLMKLNYPSWEKQIVKTNIKRYLKEEMDVHPSQ